MEHILKKYYSEMNQIGYFYIDRILRLMPQYLFYMVVTVILYYTVGISNTSYIKEMNIVYIIENALVLPLGYYMYNGLEACMIIVPAWTLGLEATFYMVFPFIFKLNKKFILALISMIIFILAYTGTINTDYFGYRLLPGTLFIFLTGAIIQDEGNERNFVKVGVILAISIVLFINIHIFVEYRNLPYNKEVLLGLIVGIPILLYLKNKKMRKIDILLGDLSYGMYLNHIFIIYIMGKIPQNYSDRILLIMLSIGLSFITYIFIEKPAMKFRRDYRNNKIKNLEMTKESIQVT